MNLCSDSSEFLTRCGVIVEVNCETDFVARGDLFRGLASAAAAHLLAHGFGGAASPDEALAAALEAPLAGDDARTLAELVKEHVAATGENIQIRRCAFYELE